MKRESARRRNFLYQKSIDDFLNNFKPTPSWIHNVITAPYDPTPQKKMRLRVVGKPKVILIPLEDEKVTASGIHLVRNRYETHAVGRVVSSNVRDLPAGTDIVYRRFDAIPIEVKDMKLVVVLLDHVVGIYERQNITPTP
jgi:co-chaperonin GroES (HSP10)